MANRDEELDLAQQQQRQLTLQDEPLDDADGTDSEEELEGAKGRVPVKSKGKSRRKACEKPEGSDQKRQAFSKRKRGLILKSYQLYKLTDARVFVFIVNDKGSSWAYASPGFARTLSNPHLLQMREYAQLSNHRLTTEIMPHPHLDAEDRRNDDRPHVMRANLADTPPGPNPMGPNSSNVNPNQPPTESPSRAGQSPSAPAPGGSATVAHSPGPDPSASLSPPHPRVPPGGNHLQGAMAGPGARPGVHPGAQLPGVGATRRGVAGSMPPPPPPALAAAAAAAAVLVAAEAERQQRELQAAGQGALARAAGNKVGTFRDTAPGACVRGEDPETPLAPFPGPREHLPGGAHLPEPPSIAPGAAATEVGSGGGRGGFGAGAVPSGPGSAVTGSDSGGSAGRQDSIIETTGRKMAAAVGIALSVEPCPDPSRGGGPGPGGGGNDPPRTDAKDRDRDWEMPPPPPPALGGTGGGALRGPAAAGTGVRPPAAAGAGASGPLDRADAAAAGLPPPLKQARYREPPAPGLLVTSARNGDGSASTAVAGGAPAFGGQAASLPPRGGTSTSHAPPRRGEAPLPLLPGPAPPPHSHPLSVLGLASGSRRPLPTPGSSSSMDASPPSTGAEGAGAPLPHPPPQPHPHPHHPSGPAAATHPSSAVHRQHAAAAAMAAVAAAAYQQAVAVAASVAADEELRVSAQMAAASRRHPLAPPPAPLHWQSRGAGASGAAPGATLAAMASAPPPPAPASPRGPVLPLPLTVSAMPPRGPVRPPAQGYPDLNASFTYESIRSGQVVQGSDGQLYRVLQELDEDSQVAPTYPPTAAATTLQSQGHHPATNNRDNHPTVLPPTPPDESAARVLMCLPQATPHALLTTGSGGLAGVGGRGGY